MCRVTTFTICYLTLIAWLNTIFRTCLQITHLRQYLVGSPIPHIPVCIGSNGKEYTS